MKQEITPVYKEMEEEIKKIALRKQEKSTTVCIGKPMYLPLNGQEIKITYYKAKEKKAPIIFGTYGGEFEKDNYLYECTFWEMISREFKCNVVYISYDNFSKSKFPCAINDIYDVICYFVENAADFDFDTNRVMVYGSGIGANFVTAAAMLDKANKTNYIKTQILSYPYLDFSSNSNKQLISPKNYVNDDAELKNPFVSPIYASQEELEGMPKTIIICGGQDSLLKEDQQYAKMLEESGTEVYCQNYSEMDYGFVELYFLLKYMPPKSQILSERTWENFISGKLYKSVKSSIQFIKEHCS